MAWEIGSLRPVYNSFYCSPAPQLMPHNHTCDFCHYHVVLPVLKLLLNVHLMFLVPLIILDLLKNTRYPDVKHLNIPPWASKILYFPFFLLTISSLFLYIIFCPHLNFEKCSSLLSAIFPFAPLLSPAPAPSFLLNTPS